MSLTVVKILVGLPVLIIAIFIGAVWLATRIPKTEVPPCENCIYDSTESPAFHYASS